tara:strand:- start:27 stop:242 length:216 start_codon:yes stop_codon:yes gene_type:complete
MPAAAVVDDKVSTCACLASAAVEHPLAPDTELVAKKAKESSPFPITVSLKALTFVVDGSQVPAFCGMDTIS